jgi:hypothetical protein
MELSNEALKMMFDDVYWDGTCFAPTTLAHVARELLEAREELQKPARQCENCEEYYAESVLKYTEDDVPLCPGCYEECAKEYAALTEKGDEQP